MYSVILMAALTTGGDATTFNCRGCFGGWGGWGARHGCRGYYGGCYGSYYGCNGCSGYNGYSGCNGCSGCYGGYGGVYTYASIGYYGYGCWGYGCNGCYGGYGCHGQFGCTGAPHIFSMVPLATGGATGTTPPGGTNPEKNPEKIGMPEKKDGVPPPPGEENLQVSLSPYRASLIVTLPADAKLFVDGHPMQTPAEKRVFQTPPLEPGQLYYYTLRAEVERDGKTITRTQRVIVQGGAVTRAAFSDLPSAAAVLTAQANGKN
jgi:uncharacterized protein (TIGR03000 family)